MPYLSITSNQPLDTKSGQLETLSRMLAEALGKPESYVMVELQHNPDMLFAGSNDPLAYCQLKSLGLQETRTAALSETICNSLHELYAIEPSRIYIEFAAPARPMWGWDKKTF
ncbi:MAG: phenylpyruvate tautomerase MIF-related protein [Gammaproteobacteria bacterium]|nr:phenylpyruvate tautomerase MIF-related protein [Gammaproteobacteria bacterium]